MKIFPSIRIKALHAHAQARSRWRHLFGHGLEEALGDLARVDPGLDLHVDVLDSDEFAQVADRAVTYQPSA